MQNWDNSVSANTDKYFGQRFYKLATNAEIGKTIYSVNTRLIKILYSLSMRHKKKSLKAFDVMKTYFANLDTSIDFLAIKISYILQTLMLLKFYGKLHQTKTWYFAWSTFNGKDQRDKWARNRIDIRAFYKKTALRILKPLFWKLSQNFWQFYEFWTKAFSTWVWGKREKFSKLVNKYWKIILPILKEKVENLWKKQDTKTLPLVVIAGKPNVGKSTLFNRLIEEASKYYRKKPQALHAT